MRFAIAILLSASLLGGCGSEDDASDKGGRGAGESMVDRPAASTVSAVSPLSAPPTIGLTKDQAISLIPPASSIPNDEFTALARMEKIEVSGHQLSLILFTLDPFRESESNPRVLEDFRYIGERFPNPAEMAAKMWASKSLGYATMLQPQYIDELTIDSTDTQATGTIEFAAPDLYKGKVRFRAEQVNGDWAITEFELPHYKIVTRLLDDVWQRIDDKSPQ